MWCHKRKQSSWEFFGLVVEGISCHLAIFLSFIGFPCIILALKKNIILA
jgi:hypothetical protein